MQFHKLPDIWWIVYGFIIGLCVTFALSFAMFQEQVTDDYIYYALYFSEITGEMRDDGIVQETIYYMGRLSSHFCRMYGYAAETILLPGSRREYKAICDIIRLRNTCNGSAMPALINRHECEALHAALEETRGLRDKIISRYALPDYVFDESSIPFGNITLPEFVGG